MAKFYGEIGYGESVQSPAGSGIWKDVITEVTYIGDVIRNVRKMEEGESLNPNISLSNSISIIADDKLNQHFHAIRYIRWDGGLWTVTSVEVRPPRLILSLGSVYNGPIA